MFKTQRLAGAFALFLFLCFVYSCNGDTDRETIAVFKSAITEVFDKENTNTLIKRKPLAFRVPAFVGGVLNGKEFFVVICDARYNGISDSTIIEPVARTSYGNYKTWSDAEFIVHSEEKSANYAVVGNVTAVMKENKIYMLVSCFDTSNTSEITPKSKIHWDTLMFVGTVVNGTESGGEVVTIVWQKEKSLKYLLQSTINDDKDIFLIGGVGNGVVTKKGTIVLPIQIKHRDNDYDAASIIYSKDNGKTWRMGEVTYWGTAEGSVAEFANGKLLFAVHFSGGVREAYESDDLGATWKTSPVFMGVWGNEQNRNSAGNQGSVITAPVDKENVLLFSHPLNTDESHMHDTLQLWVSDGRRIRCVGTISKKDKGEQTGNSILAYIGNNLYVTHEINPRKQKQRNETLNKWRGVIAISPLQKLYKRVKKTVRVWRQIDAWARTEGIPADELVGFLENKKKDDAVWTDKYNCVNATVSNAINVNGGFRFSGAADSGAQWPVAIQGQNQLYKFTREQFTLSATVKIHHGGGAEGVSLLGAINDDDENSILIGIGYTQNQKWYTLNGNGLKNFTNFSFELEKEYHIALTFIDGDAHIYVDGVNITNGTQTTYHSTWIDHFYMGSMGTHLAAEGSSCTINNVMLFKQSLEQEQIAQLANVMKNSRLNKTTIKEKPTNVPVNSQSVQTTEYTDFPVSQKSVQTVKPTTFTESQTLLQTREPKKLPSSDKKLSTATSKQTSISDTQKNRNGNKKDKGIDHFMHKFFNATFQNNIKHADSSSVLCVFFQFMCFGCSIIVLAGV